jgi:hypothetical protein
MATRTIRTLTVTSALVFKSLDRMVPLVARASSVWTSARRRKVLTSV